MSVVLAGSSCWSSWSRPVSRRGIGSGQASLPSACAAPEIVGTDVDGKPMKLSDFRGKIVMLDFWGDW